MFDQLSNLKANKSKRIFFAVSTGFLLLFYFLFYQLEAHENGPFFKDQKVLFSTFDEILVNLIATTITALIVIAILIFLVPVENKLKSAEVLDRTKTKKLHSKTLKESSFWLHNGQLGRWIRVSVMPYFAGISVKKEAQRRIELVILNPANKELCDLYLKYRKSIDFREEHFRTREDIQAELLSTIIASHRYDNDNTPLSVKVFLTNHLWLIREDINSVMSFRTHVDPRYSSIGFYNKNAEDESDEFYNSAMSNFEYTKQLSIKVPRVKEETEFEYTADRITEYLKKIDLLIHDDANFINNILTRLNSAKTPYGN